MTEDEFVQALVDAKKPKQVHAVFQQYAAEKTLVDKAALLESLRLQREVAPTPADSGAFFQRLLQQSGGKVIPLK